MFRAFHPVAASILALTACAWAVPLSAETERQVRRAQAAFAAAQKA